MLYKIEVHGDVETLTAVVGNQLLTAVKGQHPSYEELVAAVRGLAGDISEDELSAMFSVSQQIAVKAESLGARVSITDDGKILFDGVESDTALDRHIARFVQEGDVSDWKPLVAFRERIENNPNAHSREQLLKWLEAEDFSITPDGLIVGYKYVNLTADVQNGKPVYCSSNRGPGYVNGEYQPYGIRQQVGDVVSMDRGDVTHDPTVGCSNGLHVGTWGYVKYHPTILEVHVDPANVVSVPTDCDWSKMRVCEYTIAGVVTEKYSLAVLKEKAADPLDDPNWDWSHE